MKRSRRERKISKVMGEFKDGSLKSGGSGRKVTNPKQAMAIALSEANRMNQGGIVGLAQMQSPFANSIRPQAQTMGPRPIAPGPQQMGPMQRNFMQMQNQMRGMQQNPLALYQGYLGQKYIGPMQQEQENKINQFVGAVSQAERQTFGNQQGGKTFGGRLQPGMPGSGLMPPRNQAPDVMPPMNQAPAVMPRGYSDRAAQLEPVFMNQGGMMYSDIMNRPMFQTPQQRQGMGIMAGVAPVRGYASGDLADKQDGTEEEGEGLFNEALAKASEMGEDAVNYLLENPVEAALMFIPGVGVGAGLAVKFGPKIISGLRRAASKAKAPKKAAGKKQKAPPKSPSAPASSKKAPDADAPAKKSVTRQVLSGARQGFRPRVAIPGAAAAYAVNQLIESGALDQYINDPRVQQLIEAGTPVYEAVTTFFGDVAEIISPDTGERVELTESAQARLPEVEKARKEGFPEKPAAKKDDGTGTPAPEATGIMKFLFGKDGIGGDPGAVGKTMDYLADPRTRYALARAAESRPGVVDRNFFTDFTLGQAEYDQLQGKDETALMQNYEFLKAAGKSDDEIFNLLLSKDTDSDRRRQLEEDTLSLFNALSKRDVANTDPNVLYAQALRMALTNQGQASAPQDSDVVQTVDLE